MVKTLELRNSATVINAGTEIAGNHKKVNVYDIKTDENLAVTARQRHVKPRGVKLEPGQRVMLVRRLPDPVLSNGLGRLHAVETFKVE